MKTYKSRRTTRYSPIYGWRNKIVFGLNRNVVGQHLQCSLDLSVNVLHPHLLQTLIRLNLISHHQHCDRRNSGFERGKTIKISNSGGDRGKFMKDLGLVCLWYYHCPHRFCPQPCAQPLPSTLLKHLL